MKKDKEPSTNLICIHVTRPTKVGTECVQCFSFLD